MKDLWDTSFGEDPVLSCLFLHLWPSRSPDLYLCDYWLCGYLKSQVYRDLSTLLEMLKDIIRRQFLTIPTNILYSVVFYIVTHNYREESQWCEPGDRDGHRTRAPRSIQPPEYAVFIQSRTGAKKCAGSPIKNHLASSFIHDHLTQCFSKFQCL
ncbi:transposable element Tcb1 transposase [Trichonephila clavipes]|nr:transposable element Tcb1 transposase [Trichonephila clavipes]